MRARHKIFEFRSIRWRFIAAISSLSFIVISCLFLWNFFNTKKALRADQDRQINELISRLQTSLPNALWEYNYGQLRKTVNAEMEAPHIIAISVRDHANTLYAVQRDLIEFTKPPPHDSKRLIPLNYEEYVTGKKLGQAEIYISDQHLISTLKSSARKQGAQYALLLLSTILVLSVVLWFTVLLPLQQVQNALEQVAAESDDLSTRLPDDPLKEFRGITNGFNNFVGKVQRTLGGSIEDVHTSIRDVAEGDFYTTIDVAENDTTSILSRLATMQNSLRNYSENEKNAALLIAAKEAADSANRAKTEFISNMNHELRNPLAAIIGVGDLLMRSNVDEKQCKWLQSLRASSRQMLGIVNDILDFSKLEENRVVLEHVPFQLNQIIEDVVDGVHERAGHKGLEIKVLTEAGTNQTFIGDPLRISQILLNFLDNAIKYTEQGRIFIRASLIREERESGVLLLEVEDTGIGIKPELVGGLFDRFSQADTSVTRNFGGTGLGLTICRKLAELMLGSVGIKSNPGEGTRVWCQLTLAIDRETGAVGGKPALHRLFDNVSPPDTLFGKHILVAEDNDVNQMFIQSMLEEVGVQVQQAANGFEAIELVEAQIRLDRPFDLILMDLHMPRMDGLSASKHILADDPELKIIAMTADARTDVREKALRAGISGFLAKPFERSALWGILEKVMEDSGRSSRTATVQIPRRNDRSLSPKTIVIVDDDEPLCDLHADLLRENDYQVVSFYSGETALPYLLDEKSIDCVIVDNAMPGMSGAELIRKIQQDGYANPIIILSGNVGEFDTKKPEGVTAVLQKPTEAADLCDAIKRAVC